MLAQEAAFADKGIYGTDLLGYRYTGAVSYTHLHRLDRSGIRHVWQSAGTGTGNWRWPADALYDWQACGSSGWRCGKMCIRDSSHPVHAGILNFEYNI